MGVTFTMVLGLTLFIEYIFKKTLKPPNTEIPSNALAWMVLFIPHNGQTEQLTVC